VIGYVFQGNLNFIRNNQKLKTATILWIVQNVFLLSSVAVRNQYYVQELGLTYKRIGVFIFLTIVFVGLICLLIKVVKTKSFFFLARMNSISVLLILSLSTAIPWDQVIVEHNLKSKSIESVDMYYLLSLSQNVQPQLNELIYKKARMKIDEKWLVYRSISDYKMDHIRYDLQEKSWLTFNLAEYNLRNEMGRY